MDDFSLLTKTIQESLSERRPLPALTLQENCFMKITTTLCNQVKLKRLIFRCKFQDNRNSFKICLRKGDEWKAVEATASEMVSQICKPVLLKKRILELLWPVSYRMIVWKSTYAPRISNFTLPHFHWTERGKVDNSKTVRCLIGNRNISARDRFALACSACLEDEILEIWRKMSVENKTYFYRGDRSRMNPLTQYWAHVAKEDDCDSKKYILDALSRVSGIGLWEAFKYLHAIVPEDKTEFIAIHCMKELIPKIVSGHFLAEDQKDIACIVFSQMADRDREFFYKFFQAVLLVLLHVRQYELCLNLLEEILKSGSVSDVAAALAIVFYTYHSEVDNEDECRCLFVEFWRKIPTRMRQKRRLRHLRMEFLCVLIRDNFPFILEKGVFPRIAELTSLDFQFNDSDRQVDFHEGKWSFLHFIIQEVIAEPLLKMPKSEILFFLKKRPSEFAVCYRMFRFVSKVQRNRNKLISISRSFF